MPQFPPSEVKTARSPITVKPSGLSCSAELYLVSNSTKVVTSGVKTFTSTGAKQDISFPITMPDAEGTYPVYLDVFTDGMLIGAFIATEDVVIAAPGPPSCEILELVWKRYRDTDVWHSISAPMPEMTDLIHRFRVKNTGSGTFYFNIGQYITGYGEGWRYSPNPIELNPNEEGYIEWVLGSGKARAAFSFTWYLFGNDTPLTGFQGKDKETKEWCDSLTVTITIS